MSDLREFALGVATTVLPAELERLPSDDFKRIRALCQLDDGAPASDVATALAEWLVSALLEPPGDAKSNVTSSDDDRSRGVAELFWRTAPLVCLMPIAALESMARNQPDLSDSDLPAEDDDAEDDDADDAAADDEAVAKRRRALVAAVLPRFSCACTTRQQAEAAVEAKREAARLRKQFEEEDRKQSEAAEEAAAEKKAAEEGGVHL